MTGFAPTIIQVSEDAKPCAPATQLPCRAVEVFAAGLSMVAAEKIIGDPSARNQEAAMTAPVGWETTPVPI